MLTLFLVGGVLPTLAEFSDLSLFALLALFLVGGPRPRRPGQAPRAAEPQVFRAKFDAEGPGPAPPGASGAQFLAQDLARRRGPGPGRGAPGAQRLRPAPPGRRAPQSGPGGVAPLRRWFAAGRSARRAVGGGRGRGAQRSGQRARRRRPKIAENLAPAPLEVSGTTRTGLNALNFCILPLLGFRSVFVYTYTTRPPNRS